MSSSIKRITLLYGDIKYITLNDQWINCVTAENAEYLINLEENVLKLQEENKLLKRRLGDMRELHGLYGNH